MMYKVIPEQQEELKDMHESGMGYQFILARFAKQSLQKELIVLNGKLIIENDDFRKTYLEQTPSKELSLSVENAEYIELEDIKLIGQNPLLNVPDKSGAQRGSAKDGPVIYPDGVAYYVRLSAWDNDIRVDKKNNCLVPESYTTTKIDYEKCVSGNDDPIERYALPKEIKIAWAFHILPDVKDGYGYGTVKPANGKRGGGIECLFKNGTSFGTFKKQTDYGIFYP